MLKSNAFRELINKSIEESNGNFLWRYLNLKKFISFLTNQSIYCSRIDCFPDSFEGKQLKLYVLEKKKKFREAFSSFNSFKKDIKFEAENDSEIIRLKLEQEKINKQFFACCWHYNELENPLFWSSYSNPEGISIRIKKNDLEYLVNNATINEYVIFQKLMPVEYKDTRKLLELENLSPELNKKYLPIYKNKIYSGEKEERILIQTTTEFSEKKIDILLSDSDLKKIVGVFHPEADIDYKNSIRTITESLQIDFELRDSLIELR